MFFHHGSIYHQYLLAGRWELPPSRLFTLLGQAGVAVFFMITGYLFWLQMLKAHGKPNYGKLYFGRIFRIYPLYIFAFTLVLTGAIVHTGPHFREPLIKIVKELIAWLCFFQPPINGYQSTYILIAGVTWSLVYEWKFYASLLIMGQIGRFRRLGLIAPVLGLLIVGAWVFVTVKLSPVYIMLFLIGMAVASARSAALHIPLPQWAGSILACLLVISTFSLFGSAYAFCPAILLGSAFYLVATGCDVFGLLTRTPSKRLGDISYGIYLLQGPVLAASFAIPGARAFALSSPIGHWSIIGLDALALVCLATATHALIERPGVDLGRYLWNRITTGRKSSMARSATSAA